MGIMKSFFSGSRRNGAIDALNKAVEIFTSHTEKTFEDVMSNGICPIANAVEVDRVIVYCRLKANREMFGQVYRWDKQAGGTVPLDENLKVLPPIPAVMQWLALSLKGESIVRRLDKMSKEEMNFANAFGIKSIALLPIYTYGECWGAIAFQDHTRQRDFDDCIDLLYSAARLYANAIIRHDITLEANRAIEIMERQKKMADVLNKSAVMFVSQNKETFDEKMTAGLELICGMAKVSRLSIWRNHVLPDGLRCSQVYCWDKETGSGSSDPKLANLSYAKFAPEWEELLKHGNIINGPVKILPGSDLFKYNSALSALVVPLFIENSFWGFMLFEDQSHERLFDDDYVEIMRSTAFLCASVLIKTEMEHIITEANELNNTLINSAPISIIIFDENAHIIDCNDTTLKMFNCEKQYFQKHFFDLSTEYQVGGLKSRDKAMVFVRRALKGETVTFEWMHSSKSGELIPSEVTLIRVNYSGKTVGLGYIYDLRNIKKMEVIIGEAQEKAHSIAEASPFSYILFDEDQQAIDCNEAALQIFGCEDKQYFLDNYLTLFSPEIQPNGQKSVETIKAILTKALNEKKTSYEWFHQTIDGELLPMENTLTPLKFKDSKYVISFKYDLRPRKKLMDEINRQNQQLTFRLEQQQLISEISKNFISGGDLYALINDALGKLGKNLDVSRMFVFHMDYECLDCHAIYQWYRDCSAPKVKRGPDFDIFSLISAIFPEGWPEGKAVSMVSCADVSASKDEKICELKTYDVMSFLCSPIYVDGHLWGILSAEHCFAPHGWTDDETSFFVMASSIISGAIMRSIYDIRLKESLNKVTSLSKAKDNFLSKISHEIRTPMNSILGITEVQLRNESLPYSTREALGIIYHSGDSLLRIINDLLDLSKIEEKELEITPAKYEIASLISDSVQLNMLQVESKPIEFKLDVDENTPLRFFGDALRIKQILNNVLSNAFKYTDKGRVSMSVSMEKNEGNYDVTLVFCISDTGQGMTEEQVNMLFASEYSRFDMVSNRLIEGSGLGTAIVRHLLSIMDGDISVKSELGKGSSFTIRIPQKTAGPEVLGQELAENLRKFRARNYLQIEKSQIIYDPMPHGKILIVDDVESNLYVTRSLLAPYDLSIETVTSGFAAVEKIKNGKVYDIIFMDYMMPKMDGIETTKALRDLGYSHPIVALTANAIAGQSKFFLENGFNGFISKPIDSKNLNAELNKFIRDKQMPPLPEASPALSAINLLPIFAQDAKKALPVFESVLGNVKKASNEDLRLYAVKAHAMKSAFANIGESVLSEMAFELEKAGKEKNRGIIERKTKNLIDALKSVIEKSEVWAKEDNGQRSEDTQYLCGQLKKIGEACSKYDVEAANVHIANLNEKSWTKKTEDIIGKISECILYSDFEEASAIALKACV